MADPELVPSGQRPGGLLEAEAVALATAALETRLPGMPRQRGASPVLVAGAVGIPDPEALGGTTERVSRAVALPAWGRLETQLPAINRAESDAPVLVAGPVAIPDPEAVGEESECRSGTRLLPPRRRLLGPAHRPGRVELNLAAAESLLPLVDEVGAPPVGDVLEAPVGALSVPEGIATPRVPVTNPALTGLIGLAPAQRLEALPDIEPVSIAAGVRAAECNPVAPEAIEVKAATRSFRRQPLAALPPLSAYDGPQAEFHAAPAVRGLRRSLSLQQLGADAAAVGLELRKKTVAARPAGVPVGRMRVSELVRGGAPPVSRLGDLPAAALFVPKATLAPLRPACCFGPMPSSGEAGARPAAAPVLPFRVDSKAGAQESQPAKAQGRR